jgi:phosphoglycolate phosphatase-like HAD superfamily hydrolase
VRKLILFDIDGTLARGGPAKEAFSLAMMATFGSVGAIESYDFSGKTDPQIARDLLSTAGVEDAVIDAGLPALWDAYIGELESRIVADPMKLLPGVGKLVETLRLADDVALGLVTGNILRGARLKLASVGLAEHFRVGGYGSDHEVRDHLPGFAVARAVDAWGVTFAEQSVVVIGDTPRDVQCGKHHGTRTVAVATGRFDGGQLEQTGADAVFEDFSDVDHVLEVLLQ